MSKQAIFRKQRGVSVTFSSFSDKEVKEKAAERYCLELALFKEDYEKMKKIKKPDAIEAECIRIREQYLVKKALNELNLSVSLREAVEKQYAVKNYAILDEVYMEVKMMLFQNLELQIN